MRICSSILPRAHIQHTYLQGTYFVLLFACIIMLSSCVTKNEQGPIGWNLSEGAQETYISLLLDQSIRTNDLEGVRMAAEHILQSPPNRQRSTDIAAWLLLAREYELARDILKKTLTAFPNELTLHLLLAEAYLELNQVQEALACITSFAAKNPNHPLVAQELAVLNMKAGKIDKALVLFEALPLTARTPFIRYFHAQTLKEKMDFANAAYQLRKAVEMSPEFIEAWSELANIYTLQNKISEAGEAYEALLALKPDIQEPWLSAVRFYITYRQPEKALALTRQVPNAYAFLLTTATLMIEAGAFPEVVKLVDQLLANYPDEPDIAFFQAAIAFNHTNDVQKALQFLKTIPSDAQYYEQAVNLHVHLLIMESQLQEALALVEEARNALPESKTLVQLEIQLLIFQEKYAEALQVLEENKSSYPDEETCLYTKGSLYHAMKEPKKALATMEEIILINPHHYQALNYIGYTLADEKIDLPRALILLTKAAILAPSSAYILDSLAWAEFRNGEIQTALKTIRRAIALPDAKEATIWEHYGDIAHAAGEKSEAIQAWEKALTLEPSNATQLQEKLQRP